MTAPDPATDPATGLPADVADLSCLDAAAAVLAAQLLPEIEAVLAEVAGS